MGGHRSFAVEPADAGTAAAEKSAVAAAGDTLAEEAFAVDRPLDAELVAGVVAAGGRAADQASVPELVAAGDAAKELAVDQESADRAVVVAGAEAEPAVVQALVDNEASAVGPSTAGRVFAAERLVAVDSEAPSAVAPSDVVLARCAEDSFAAERSAHPDPGRQSAADPSSIQEHAP